MYEIPEIDIIKDDDYRMRCIVNINGKKREVIFSRNDYDIVFISFGDSASPDTYLRAIYVPRFIKEAKPQIYEDLIRVHPSVPIICSASLYIPSFCFGLILGDMNVNIN